MDLLRQRDHLAHKFAVARERQAKVGTVAIPQRSVCLICKKHKPVTDMVRIPTTGVVKGVMDCFCSACAKEHPKEVSALARIVCAGCREVVAAVEPFVERTGFPWVAGRFYHVSECPVCSKKLGLTESQIAEKICFYKSRGIPYS